MEKHIVPQYYPIIKKQKRITKKSCKAMTAYLSHEVAERKKGDIKVKFYKGLVGLTFSVALPNWEQILGFLLFVSMVMVSVSLSFLSPHLL